MVSSSRQRKALFLDTLSFLLFVAGVVAMCCPNFWARRTYVSENALLPGSAEHKFNHQDYYLATQITNQWSTFKSSSPNRESDSKWLVDKMESLGLESYRQKFHFSNPNFEGNSSQVEEAFNIHSVVRAPKSVGTESIVIATRYNRRRDLEAEIGTATGLGLAISLQKYFQSSAQKWLAKDIILILTDESVGPEIGLKKWLETYLGLNKESSLEGISTRHGLIQAALVLDLVPSSQLSGFHVSLVGGNGHLPNLDLFNTFNQVCNSEGYYDEELELSEMPGRMRYYLDTAKELLANIAKDFVPSEISAVIRNPPNEVFGLFGFMMNQAIGIPTGEHGVFNMFHIDAMTIQNRLPKGSWSRKHPALSFGKIVEGTVRSLNNLLEKLHQSFYYYLLPSSSRYLAIGDYMIPLGMILAGLALKVALVLISLKHDKHAAFSLSLVSLYQFYGFIIFSLPFTLNHLGKQLGLSHHVDQLIFVWLILSLLLLLIMKVIFVPLIGKAIPRAEPGNNFGTFLRVPIVVFLAAGSLLNYSFCFFASLLVVPLCALVGGANNKFTRVIQLIILLSLSPISLIILLSSVTSLSPLQLLSTLYLQFVEYSNLTFPFLCIAFIPLSLTLGESIFMEKSNKRC